MYTVKSLLEAAPPPPTHTHLQAPQLKAHLRANKTLHPILSPHQYIELNSSLYNDDLKLNLIELVNAKRVLIRTALACFEALFLFWL